jgi:hypothetical protein
MALELEIAQVGPERDELRVPRQKVASRFLPTQRSGVEPPDQRRNAPGRRIGGGAQRLEA